MKNRGRCREGKCYGAPSICDIGLFFHSHVRSVPRCEFAELGLKIIYAGISTGYALFSGSEMSLASVRPAVWNVGCFLGRVTSASLATGLEFLERNR